MSGRLIILPKKQWHVRNQDNIDRVRKDEAAAAAEEAEVERRRVLAEREARTRLLRDRAQARALGHGNPAIGPLVEEASVQEVVQEDEASQATTKEVTDASGHINFFQEAERGEDKVTTNAENEAEKKKEQDEYEKKMGYLVGLGQDTEETSGKLAWWKGAAGERILEPTPSQLNSTVAPLATVRAKQKDFLDPLNSVRKYLGCEGVRLTMKSHEKKLETEEKRAINFESVKSERKKKKKKERKRSRSRSRGRKKKRRRSRSEESSHRRRKKRRRSPSSESSSSSEEDAHKKAVAKKNLEKMRRERLERERSERQRADRLVFGECEEDKKKKKEEEEKAKKQKYNQQFNPDIAKQNKLDPKRKYWLEG